MNSNADAPKKKNQGRNTKSAGPSSAGSPSLARKALVTKSGDKPLEDAANTSTFIDIDRISNASSLLEVTTVLGKTASALTQCPCEMLDRKCIAIKCTNCTKDWHTECCNLSGVTPTVARKLEGQSWQCPWCFKPSIPKPGTLPLKNDHTDELAVSMSRFQKCAEELNDNASTVEFFNQHIKHLLLDDTKFKTQSEKLDKLSTDLEDLKNQFKHFSDNCASTNNKTSTDDVCEEIGQLKELLKELQSTNPCIPPHFHESLDKIAAFPLEEISNTDESIKKLTENVSRTEEGVQTLSDNVNKMANKLATIPTLPTDVAPDDLRKEIGNLKEVVNEISTKSLEVSSSLHESIEKISSFPLEKINSTEENVKKLAENVSEMANTLSRSCQHPSRNEASASSPMQPNTISPHHQSAHHLSNEPEQSCQPFVKYEADAIEPNMRSSIIDYVENLSSQFKTIGADESRDVLYFGEYSYRYSGGQHDANEIPQEISSLINHIRPKLPDPEARINSCLISRYRNGDNYIAPHRDDEPVINPESNIATVSIGAARTMRFTNNNGSEKIDQTLEDGSLLVASRFSQDFWLHEIIRGQSEEVRYSFTLREVAPHFLNSTIILGDSNTEHIKFGTGKGTLGAWMPGKRIKVGHVDAIPDASEIGPYRNIVIHTGVNSLNNSRFRQSNASLIRTIESKIKNITTSYPKAKIFLSLLLPSRSRPLNHRIVDFNNMLLDLTCKFDKVNVIENSIFGSSLSSEHGRWKRDEDESNRFIPNFNDILHLGKHGMRLFAMNIKSSVIKKKSQSRERFNGGRGDYMRAAERGASHQGDQQSH